MLEEMRQAFSSQRESVTLSAVVERCGGWYLEQAKSFASWVSPAPDLSTADSNPDTIMPSVTACPKLCLLRGPCSSIQPF